MNNKSSKYRISFLITITVVSIFMSFIPFTYSQIVYSTSLPSLSESIQDSQQDLQSLINKQVQQTITNTVEDVTKENDNSNNGNSSRSNINNINSENVTQQIINTTETKKVTVGDIDIAYKIFGKGDPLLLIPGFSMTMEMWGPVLNNLAQNHTVIIFDNRGIGETTAGNQTFSMEKFVNDTSRFIDALEIEKPIDVLGYSYGGFIAQELTLSHPEKVNHLILVATSCGGEEAIPPQITPEELQQMQSGTANATLFLHTLFPSEWIIENVEYINKSFVIPRASQESLDKYIDAGDQWGGVCNSISNIDKSVLVLVGARDITAPPLNSLRLVEQIPGAWLVQIQDAGHGLFIQYPEKVSQIIDAFLSIT